MEAIRIECPAGSVEGVVARLGLAGVDLELPRVVTRAEEPGVRAPGGSAPVLIAAPATIMPGDGREPSPRSNLAWESFPRASQRAGS